MQVKLPRAGFPQKILAIASAQQPAVSRREKYKIEIGWPSHHDVACANIVDNDLAVGWHRCQPLPIMAQAEGRSAVYGKNPPVACARPDIPDQHSAIRLAHGDFFSVGA